MLVYLSRDKIVAKIKTLKDGFIKISKVLYPLGDKDMITTIGTSSSAIVQVVPLYFEENICPVIADIDSDNIITSTQTNVICTGINFGVFSAGVSKLELAEIEDFDLATIVIEQSIDNWTSEFIQFDVVVGTLLD